ncbi:MAG: hypothetical protein A3K77_05625 [Euryarchaeota archaeon RBG_13_31_8]|nr:MAG: hypothetical protein A3K77_05625 [Euryarchaeota archaeon RBG_13_31_8]
MDKNKKKGIKNEADEPRFDVEIIATKPRFIKKPRLLKIRVDYLDGHNIDGKPMIKSIDGILASSSNDIFISFTTLKDNRLIYIPWHRIIIVVGLEPLK